MQTVTIWSEGTRMGADLFVPEDLTPGERRPAILLCHGWAGPKAHLGRTYAPFFCEAGFVCLTFDYRGWYESDSRLATMEAQPTPDADGFAHIGLEGQQIAAAMSRGEIEVVPRPGDMPDSLKGAGDYRTMWLYLPRVAARNIRVPTLIIDQEEEEYGGRENSGLAARNEIPQTTKVEYHVLPGTHYDIYEKNYRVSAQLARDWFLEHL